MIVLNTLAIVFVLFCLELGFSAFVFRMVFLCSISSSTWILEGGVVSGGLISFYAGGGRALIFWEFSFLLRFLLFWREFVKV